MRGAWLLAALVAAGCDDTVETEETDTGGPPSACPWDEDDDPTQAGTLTAGAAEGYLCPVGDLDWYQVAVPANQGLLTVSLSIDAPVSPVQLSYTVYDGDGAAPVGAPSASESATAEAALSVTHGLGPGDYLLQIRDVGADGEDVRHAYALAVSTAADPDAHEPNGDVGSATTYSGAMTGYVAFRGDEDFYEIGAAARSLLRISLTAAAGGFEPQVRVLDPSGVELVRLSNPAGSREATDLSYVQALSEGGTYHVVVSDDDGRQQDAATSYLLTLTVEADPDGNEANDHPADATALSAASCTGAWSGWSTDDGYIATSGDVDWFALDLSGCTGGILEALANLDDTTSLPADYDLELRLLREVSGETCTVDQDCSALSRSCTDHLDCEGLGNTCLPSHVCAGAGLCLPSGSCGANALTEVAGAATPGDVTLSAPLDGGVVWLAVSDHRGDAWSADHPYSMGARVRLDPDTHEPNEVYTAGPPTGNAAARHAQRAVEIPVHDCTMGDCCDSTTWETGYLAYDYDQDWFRYQHPCPGEDCMVRVHYDLPSGPVDPYLRIFDSTDPWYDNLADATDQGSWSGVIGTFGGLDPSDECLYAWQGHSGSPFWYFLTVRDTVYVNSSAPTGGTWDHSAEQAYGVCVEKLAASCVDPCVLYSNGCGPP